MQKSKDAHKNKFIVVGIMFSFYCYKFLYIFRPRKLNQISKLTVHVTVVGLYVATKWLFYMPHSGDKVGVRRAAGNSGLIFEILNLHKEIFC